MPVSESPSASSTWLLVTARADYMLFVNGKAVGTLEAKKASLSQELRRMQA
jgi:type I site-specific restriction endonuclease